MDIKKVLKHEGVERERDRRKIEIKEERKNKNER
jgi:hypothetical protein